LRELCEQCDIELIEGHAMPDHVHLCLSIPRGSFLTAPWRGVCTQRPLSPV
jgi:REP element-mobilizing transposase RayT